MAKRKGTIYKKWSQEEEEVLKKYYGKIPNTELSRVLGRSPIAIMHKARSLGLSFPEGSVDYDLLKKLVEIYEG